MTVENERTDDSPKPFLEHLSDLRTTILWSLGALAAGMGVAVPLTPYIFKILRAPLTVITPHPEQYLRSLDITGGFSIAMQIIVWTGVLFSAPFITFIIGRFVFPGLTRRERRAITGSFGFAILLFIFGVAMGYYLALPTGLKVMLDLHAWLGIQAEWTATSYIAFTVQLLVAFGLAFELPVVVLILGYLGIVSSAVLRHYRRHAVVAILILSGVLTPDPSWFSQLIMAVPMIFLYEMCVWVVWAFERNKSKTDTGVTVIP